MISWHVLLIVFQFSMGDNILRRRIPWGQGATAEEEMALTEIDLGAAEGGIAETALGAEEGAAAFEAFSIAEGVGAGLDETGVGLPIGITIGFLAALGYGAYEIYHHLKGEVPIEHIEKHLEKIKLDKLKADVHEAVDVGEHEEGDNTEYDYQPALTLPGTKYVGPGNSMNLGTPVVNIDADAYEHDHAYIDAKDKYDVYKADETFIQKAGDHLAEGISNQNSLTDLVGGAIGYGGIKSKNIIEKAVGKSIYPQFSGKYGLEVN